MRYTVTIEFDLPVADKAAIDLLARRYFERTYGTPWPHDGDPWNTLVEAIVDWLQLADDGPFEGIVADVRSAIGVALNPNGGFPRIDHHRRNRADATTVLGHVTVANHAPAIR